MKNFLFEKCDLRNFLKMIISKRIFACPNKRKSFFVKYVLIHSHKIFISNINACPYGWKPFCFFNMFQRIFRKVSSETTFAYTYIKNNCFSIVFDKDFLICIAKKIFVNLYSLENLLFLMNTLLDFYKKTT